MEIPSEVAQQFSANPTTKALHDTHPNWTQDGFGLRGQQEMVVRENVRPSSMNFGIDATQKIVYAPPSS